jgi:putative ABC transport system permease protein
MRIPDEGFKGPGAVGVVIRSNGLDNSLITTIRQSARQLNSENVVFGVRTMESLISESLATRQFSMILLGIFAAFALLLASVGIYGVISYLVGQRTHEIGVRVVLGAQRGDVLRLVLGQGAKFALIGVAIGLVAALGLTQFLAKYSMLYSVSPTDPLAIGAAAALLTVVALGACYIPARRAMRVDPIHALRHD